LNLVDAINPKAVMLENVRGLLDPKFADYRAGVENRLAGRYQVSWKLLNASDFGVPQHRERVFIVCFSKRDFPQQPPFAFPAPLEGEPKLSDILDPSPPDKYTLTDHLWRYLQDYAKRHAEKGNGFGFGLARLDGITRTLIARYYKDGSEILISQGPKKNPRRLTPMECARLMGYPKEFKITVSDTQAYRQFGNSVVVPVVERIAEAVLKTLATRLPKNKG
jgi:DNA (cytosine-5)-methyltransferase 1